MKLIAALIVKRAWQSILLGVMMVLTASHSIADDISIGVASNFTAPMKQLVQTFEQQSPHRVKVSYGSSGKLYAQIRHGAPFQLFFSADQDKPEKLVEEGLAVAGSGFTYAIGQLVLWSADNTLLLPQADLKTVLLHKRVKRIALANPRLAPYGMAAAEVLSALSITNATRNKWVMGENIAQTYHFVSTGNASLGFIARAQLPTESPDVPGSSLAGSYVQIPQSLYSPIRQDVVLLQKGVNHPAALAFLSFMRGDQARNIIQTFGYGLFFQGIPAGESMR